MKKISIIVPVYNVKEYMEQCIDSLINQTYKNLEIIVVDDGSTDESSQLCDQLKKKDNRISVYHKSNGGLSDARNYGLSYATGDYIGFVDSDDWISLSMYEDLMRMADKYNADIVSCGRYIHNSKKILCCRFTSIEKTYSSEKALKEILLSREIDVAMWDKIFRADLFKDISFPVGENNEDIAIFYKLIGNANLIVHSGTIGYHYRKRQGSITHSRYSSQAATILLKHLYNLKQYIIENFPELKEDYKKYLAVNNYFLITEYIQKNGVKQSKEYSKLREIFNETFPLLILHKNFEFKRKIAAVFVWLNIYSYYEKMKRIIKGNLHG